MKEKSQIKYAPKVVFWISFFVIVFAFVAITDSLGFKLPLLVPDTRNASLYDFSHKQPFYVISSSGKSTFKAKNTLHTSPKNISTTAISDMTTKLDSKSLAVMKTHVAFLKVHKAGSTTMQNLFFRFGIRHNLNILLPRGGNYLYSPDQKLPLRSGQHYDIFACHTVYNTKWFKSLLPADSVNIAIVREPVERMISSAYYYRDISGIKYLKRIPSGNFIHNLVNYPEKYNSAFFSQTRNSMGKDFGFRSGIQQNEKNQIKSYLDKLSSEFLLVMILEKFNESLVTLKRLLNWSFIDIIYLKTNSHKHNPVMLNATEIANFRKTSYLDFEIYDYFTEVFETKLKTIGNDLYDEVKFFQNVLDRVHDFCLANAGKEASSVSVLSSKWDKQFEVKTSDCQLMNASEKIFFKKLRFKYHETTEIRCRKHVCY